MLIALGVIVVAVTVYLMVKQYETRLVLFGAGMACASTSPCPPTAEPRLQGKIDRRVRRKRAVPDTARGPARTRAWKGCLRAMVPDAAPGFGVLFAIAFERASA